MKITSFAWNRHCSKHEMCWFWLKMVGMSHFQTGIWPLCYRLISDTTTLQRFYGPATFYQNHAALEHVLYIRAGMQMQGGAFLKSRHSWSKIVASSSLVLRHPRRNWTACARSLWLQAHAFKFRHVCLSTTEKDATIRLQVYRDRDCITLHPHAFSMPWWRYPVVLAGLKRYTLNGPKNST